VFSNTTVTWTPWIWRLLVVVAVAVHGKVDPVGVRVQFAVVEVLPRQLTKRLPVTAASPALVTEKSKVDCTQLEPMLPAVFTNPRSVDNS
jgi:hypothetical protein